jgi:hypothetical protein
MIYRLSTMMHMICITAVAFFTLSNASPITRMSRVNVDSSPYVSSDANGADRTFTIYNHCNNEIWYHLTGGSVVNPHTGTDRCNSNNDCIKGTSCHLPPGLCFWYIALQ